MIKVWSRVSVTYNSMAASTAAKFHCMYGGGSNRNLKSLPLGSSMLTKAAHQKAMRMTGERMRRNWFACVVEKVGNWGRTSGIVVRIVRREVETAGTLVVADASVLICGGWVVGEFRSALEISCRAMGICKDVVQLL